MEKYNATGFDKGTYGAEWRAGIYCRLSKDDELQGESASISNQRDMLVNFCMQRGFHLAGMFQDDGYTGLNMERPGLKRLLGAAERGEINLVITKDIYYLHRMGSVSVEKVAEVMGKLIDEGLIRGWGLSQVDVDIIERAQQVTPLAAIQNIYSMVERF